MTSCAAIIVAAGRGARFGDPLPKQYASVANVPMLRHSLAAFSKHPDISRVVPVIHPEDHAHFETAANGLSPMTAVAGGETRQDSVRLGLESLMEEPPDWILVHDGARPNPGRAVIDRVMGALKDGAAGVIPVLPIPDTVKRLSSDNSITETLPRDGLARAQTPQGFVFSALLQAHQSFAGEAFTDDAAVFEKAGHTVTTVTGDEANIKVTDKSDMAALMDALTEIRTGTGFDVHRFEPGDRLILGGIEIPFEKRLAGHSDADVVLHAITDALLGALADGDIGVHFPPTDPSFADAPSEVFVQFAMERLRQRLGTLVHVDLTIICERPKVSPHRDAMRQRIADILDVPASRVSVKATTTEGLGFTGRSEGIACQASVTIKVAQDLNG